jgi:hypothetical protein
MFEKMKALFNEGKERWKSELPPFYKKARTVAIKIGGSSGAVVVANVTMGLNLNATLITVLCYVTAACVAVAGTAQLSKPEV